MGQNEKIKKSMDRAIKKNPYDLSIYIDMFDLCREHTEEDFKTAHEWNHAMRTNVGKIIQKAVRERDFDTAEKADNLLFRSLLLGAPHYFDDYLQAIEYGKPHEKKFYNPRRHYLKRYVDQYQKIIDGELDFLSISMPKRAIDSDCPVLTPNGFKRHGDLTTNDYVYGRDGKPKKVLFVHPVCAMEHEVVFSNGERIIVNGEHDWTVFDKRHNREVVMSTKEMLREGLNTVCTNGNTVWNFYIPMVLPIEGAHSPDILMVKHITEINPITEDRTGNCITVEDGEYRVGITQILTHNCGKAVTLDTLIPTPFGFKKMRDIKVGDLVMARDGYDTKVTHVFPQGKVRVYEVRFSDGAVVKTCANHLWLVRMQEKGKYIQKLLTTGDMMKNGLKSKGKNPYNIFSVPYSQPAEFIYKEVSMDPYVMGVLLGDGCFCQNNIVLTNPDKEITDYVASHIPEGDVFYLQDEKQNRWLFKSKHPHLYENGQAIPCKTMDIIRKYGLTGKKSYEKFIPSEYLYTTSIMRWELLRGLMDTDGTVKKNGGAEYATASKILCEQILFLVRSLGGCASYTERMGCYTHNGERIETRPNYRISISFPAGCEPFRLSRKAEKYKQKRSELWHYIEDIKPVGKAKAQCICVDNDEHLFLVSDYFIPTHNSQMGLNFVNMLSGRRPDRATLMEGTGDALVNSFYKGCLEYMQLPNEYHYYDIFPDCKLVQTNADDKTINLNEKSRFPTIMCRSIDSRQVGLSEATNLLYLDDCVEGREEAKDRTRLDKKWEILSGDIIGRAIEGTPIVICGTRYSLYDPIGHLQEEMRKQGKRMCILETPALDLETDESNFEYIREGKKVFTTKYFRDQRDMLSAEQFESEFQQTPFEAKGLMFPKDKLNYFFELPIDREPDARICVCDTADTGEDSLSMPIGYLYGPDIYIPDVVFDDSPAYVTKPECAKAIMDHMVSSGTFESNNAGEYFARDVNELLKGMGYTCSIITKRTISNKQTRIEFASDNIIKHFYFKHPSTYERNSQYDLFMRQVTTHTRSGKVKHDDAPDSLSLMENEMRKLQLSTVEVMKRPC